MNKRQDYFNVLIIKNPLGPVNSRHHPIKWKRKAKQDTDSTPGGCTLSLLPCEQCAFSMQKTKMQKFVLVYYLPVMCMLHLLIQLTPWSADCNADVLVKFESSSRPRCFKLCENPRFVVFQAVCVLVWQLVVVAYDDGEPSKENTTLVEITVLQPSVIPVFTQEEYRYTHTHTFH